MFNIVLVNPKIPPNTGNIGRLCVNTGSTLHLVKPLGFDIDEKSVRRAGLDYWHKLDLMVWESLEEFSESIDFKRAFFATTKSDKPYFEVNYKPGDYLIFGSETEGLPMEFMQKNWKNAVTIPMTKEGRSLNLAVSAGIILYEAIRQNFDTFKGL
ncbi:tRNA (cytidine(34)-2'-O)-methyltransferase [Nitrosophilus alvini]|uniref:tRNA (cytidine(34)-2'-O)-methyltransferase n=1 Tax=Nitrosophilus alvini TaxID=2714855 RepID=UPI00190A44D0|nr:tRNA (cytidine(34)-2'-O)-methyltransferase [Nitrosophilus alvini]